MVDPSSIGMRPIPVAMRIGRSSTACAALGRTVCFRLALATFPELPRGATIHRSHAFAPLTRDDGARKHSGRAEKRLSGFRGA